MSLIQGFKYSLIDYKNNSTGATGQPSQNFQRLNNHRFVVIHSTAGQNFETNLDILSSKKPTNATTSTGEPLYVSCHYLIGGAKDSNAKQNGNIYQLLDERLRGVHANSLNDLSIGIELIDKFIDNSKIPSYSQNPQDFNKASIGADSWLTKEEYTSFLILCCYLSKTYQIPKKYISLYENNGGNNNVINPNPLFNIDDRENNNNTSQSIEKLKKTALKGFIFHKDFRGNKSDPVFWNGFKFANDLNKVFPIGGRNYDYFEIFEGLSKETIEINDLTGFDFYELATTFSVKESFREVIKILKGNDKKREDFEKVIKDKMAVKTSTGLNKVGGTPPSVVNDGSL